MSRGFVTAPSPTPLAAIGEPPIWCKMEYVNPSGSIKDRIARYMLEKARRKGLLTEGGQVIEASSGSTSIALALMCARMGFQFTAIMPENVSNERIWMIRALGGQIELVDRSLGMVGAVKRAKELSEETGAYFTDQFANPDNIEAHRVGTGREILEQLPSGDVDAIVSGVGTGGTIVGLHHALADAGCNFETFIAKPITGMKEFGGLECCSFSQRIPGVVDSLSALYTNSQMDNLHEIEVQDEEAIKTARELIRKGYPVGASSGLNYSAAQEVVKRLGSDATVVTVFPDRMERYFSTELFAPYRTET